MHPGNWYNSKCLFGRRSIGDFLGPNAAILAIASELCMNPFDPDLQEGEDQDFCCIGFC